MDEDAIFLAAIELTSAEARAAYLDHACAGNPQLRGSVEQLLAAHQDAGSFLAGKAPGLSVTIASPNSALPVTERAGAQIGPYKLLQQIGEGGFGVVFMAEQQWPVRRKVALKIIKPGDGHARGDRPLRGGASSAGPDGPPQYRPGTTPLDAKRLRAAGLAEMQRLIREEEPQKPSTRVSTMGQPLTAIAKQRRIDARKLRQELAGELDWIVMKALEKERGRRYETANGFAADVQRFLNDEPITACPPSALYRFNKFACRNKAALTTVAIVATALVLATTVSTWQAVVATRII